MSGPASASASVVANMYLLWGATIGGLALGTQDSTVGRACFAELTPSSGGNYFPLAAPEGCAAAGVVALGSHGIER